MRLLHILAVVVVLTSAGCHPGPVIGTGPKPPSVGGTIAGFVTAQATAPLAGRKVTAIDTTSGARFDATTGVNGGYTIKVPQGTYRLEVALQAGEKIVKQPGETRINPSDLDPRRDFVISGGGQPPRPQLRTRTLPDNSRGPVYRFTPHPAENSQRLRPVQVVGIETIALGYFRGLGTC